MSLYSAANPLRLKVQINQCSSDASTCWNLFRDIYWSSASLSPYLSCRSLSLSWQTGPQGDFLTLLVWPFILVGTSLAPTLSPVHSPLPLPSIYILHTFISFLLFVWEPLCHLLGRVHHHPAALQLLINAFFFFLQQCLFKLYFPWKLVLKPFRLYCLFII